MKKKYNKDTPSCKGRAKGNLFFCDLGGRAKWTPRCHFGTKKKKQKKTKTKRRNDRHAGRADAAVLLVLCRAVRGHHVLHQHPPADAVLFLQSDRAVRPHRLHGRPRLHPAARFRRETLPR